MNPERQVGIEKNNPATQMAHFVKELNAGRGNAAGQYSGTPVQPISSPMVRTPSMMEPRPLTDEEVAERDQAAREIGILPEEEGPVNNIIGPLPEKYRSPRMTVESPAPVPTLIRSKLPSFKNVEGFDLIAGLVVVDGMSFPIPEPDVSSFKRYAMEIALDHITRELASALAELTPVQETTTSGEQKPEAPTTAEVQRFIEGSGPSTPE